MSTLKAHPIYAGKPECDINVTHHPSTFVSVVLCQYTWHRTVAWHEARTLSQMTQIKSLVYGCCLFVLHRCLLAPWISVTHHFIQHPWYIASWCTSTAGMGETGTIKFRLGLDELVPSRLIHMFTFFPAKRVIPHLLFHRYKSLDEHEGAELLHADFIASAINMNFVLSLHSGWTGEHKTEKIFSPSLSH